MVLVLPVQGHGATRGPVQLPALLSELVSGSHCWPATTRDSFGLYHPSCTCNIGGAGRAPVPAFFART